MESRNKVVVLSFVFLFIGCSSLEPSNTVPTHRTVETPDDRGIVRINKFDHMCMKPKFSPGTKLFGLIDNRCAARKTDGFSKDLRNQVAPQGLRVQAYSWTVTQEVALAELNRRAHEDECILHLGEDFEVRAIQIPIDESPPIAVDPITATPTGEAEPFIAAPSAEPIPQSGPVVSEPPVFETAPATDLAESTATETAPAADLAESTTTETAQGEGAVPTPPAADRAPAAAVPEPPAVSGQGHNVPEPPSATVAIEESVEISSAPNDPSYNEQWGLKAIEAEKAAEIFYSPNGITSEVTIAVIDTGIDYNHPDLKANMYTDSEGHHGFNFVANNKQPMDDNGHGTHVAGIAAATWSNEIGIAGVMGKHGKLMAVKVLDENGAGRTSTIINGIQYAIENGASVINLSLGMRGHSTAMQNALREATRNGATIVMAAGNDNSQLGSEHIESPAIYGGKIDGALTVGALDMTLSRSQYSNFGPDHVEIGAPGSRILSTSRNGQYETMSGTSMAAPMVAGAAGLATGFLKSRGIQPNPAAIEAILKEGSSRDRHLATYFESGNRLNLLSLGTMLETRYPKVSPQTLTENNPEVMPAPKIKNECGKMQGLACEVFQAVNQVRQTYKLEPLQPLQRCVSMAEAHSRNMALGQFFSHTCPLTGPIEKRAVQFGLTGSASENLGFGFSTADHLVEAWMKSSDSRKKILSPSFKSTGIAVSTDDQGQPFINQCFSSITSH